MLDDSDGIGGSIVQKLIRMGRDQGMGDKFLPLPPIRLGPGRSATLNMGGPRKISPEQNFPKKINKFRSTKKPSNTVNVLKPSGRCASQDLLMKSDHP